MALLAPSSCPRPDGYTRRQPERTTLFRVLQEHWATFVARAEESGSGLPSFVREEVEAFLRCGLPQRGLIVTVRPTTSSSGGWGPARLKRDGGSQPLDGSTGSG